LKTGGRCGESEPEDLSGYPGREHESQRRK
jgi:hypothetical protein